MILYNKLKQVVFTVLYSIAPVLIRRYPGYDVEVERRKQLQIPKKVVLIANRNRKLSRLLRLFSKEEMHSYHRYDASYLFVSNGLGGGIKKNIDDLKWLLQKENINVLSLSINSGESVRIDSCLGGKQESIYYLKGELVENILEELKGFLITAIHVHSIHKFPDWAISLLEQIKHCLQIPTYFSIHDYELICPRISLFDTRTLSYCGEPSRSKECNECISTNGSYYGPNVDIEEWRSRSRKVLDMCDYIICPNQTVAINMKRYFPGLEFICRAHPEQLKPAINYKPRTSNNVIVVAILGALTEIKGASVLYACAKHAKDNSLPLKFILFGYSYIDKELKKLGNVVITGKYESHRLAQLLAKANPSFVFLPSLCPETYSYTLSEAWLNNLYVVAFDIGAIAERIDGNTTLGELIPYSERNDPKLITSVLLGVGYKRLCKAELDSVLVSYKDLRHDYYPKSGK